MCPESREGVIYLGKQEGHFATAAGQEGNAGQCGDYQVQDWSRRRGNGRQRRSDRYREIEGERSSSDDGEVINFHLLVADAAESEKHRESPSAQSCRS